MPATSQLDKLISITAISVLSCFKTIRDWFRSFGFCIGGLHRVTSATMCAISSPPPHSISKRTMCRPTRLPYRGRLKWLGELSEDYAPLLHRGIGGGMYTRKAHETREASRPATTAGASRTAHNPLLATRGPPRPALLRYVGLRDAGLGSVRGVILEREKGSHLDAI